MRPWFLLLVTTACWTPRETGPRSMVGRVLDAAGEPIAGLSVETVESRWVTDAEGRFAVTYKEPSQWVGFQNDGVWARRTWSAKDDGTNVEIRLPELRHRTLRCELVEPCDALLAWDLADGLTVESRARCDRTESAALPTPAGAPHRVSCRRGAGTEAVVVKEIGEALQMEPPPVEMTVHLVTDDLPLPESCRVEVDGDPGRPAGPGDWVFDVFGTVTVRAWCDGIPVPPRRVYVRDPFRLEVVWDRDTPSLDLATIAPDVDALVLAKVEGLEHGWSLVVPRSPDGRFVLPPLERGTYGFGVHVPAERVLGIRPADGIERGKVSLAVLPDPAPGGQRALGGVLVLEKPAPASPVPVQLLGED